MPETAVTAGAVDQAREGRVPEDQDTMGPVQEDPVLDLVTVTIMEKDAVTE